MDGLLVNTGFGLVVCARRAGGGLCMAREGHFFRDFKPIAEAIELKVGRGHQCLDEGSEGIKGVCVVTNKNAC